MRLGVTPEINALASVIGIVAMSVITRHMLCGDDLAKLVDCWQDMKSEEVDMTDPHQVISISGK